jgi:type IV fimbrial biogenesis protein FimT
MRRTDSGFTLVELMIVVVVLAVIATIAIPNLRQIVQKSQIKDASGGIAGAMMLGRTQAIKSSRPVEVCVSTDGDKCSFSDSDEWEAGWIVADYATSVAITSAMTPAVIYRVATELDNDVTITRDGDIGRVTYRSDGSATYMTNAGTAVTSPPNKTFTFANTCWSKVMTITATGRVDNMADMTPLSGC